MWYQGCRTAIYLVVVKAARQHLQQCTAGRGTLKLRLTPQVAGGCWGVRQEQEALVEVERYGEDWRRGRQGMS